MTEPKFEEALAKLEKIVADLEAGELGLEESLKKYEEGIKLCTICSKKLESARKRVEVLKKSGDKFTLEPFEAEGEEETSGEEAPKQAVARGNVKKAKKESKGEGGLF